MKPNTKTPPPVDSESEDKFFDNCPGQGIVGQTDISRFVDEHIDCDEIKLQLQDHKVKRFVTTETISTQENPNIERICRQYANQDVLVKIRNGKKISIQRTKIIKP
jgi:hypothetical protein